MNTARFILLVVAITAVGCSKDEKTITSVLPDSAERVSNVQHALDAAFTDSKRVLLRSWDGRWIGMDCDTDIELHADGKAVLTEYGYAVTKYDGTYSITTAPEGTPSELTLSLKDYRGTWPVMAVYTDQSKLLLIPTEGSAEFVFGNRAGATVPGDAGSFWPFRQIPIPTQSG